MTANKTSRIFITGDTHRDIDISKLNTKNWPRQKDLTRDDCLVILGDFGGIWYGDDLDGHGKDSYFLDWYEDKPFTTLIIDGNHENHSAIEMYPEETWNGGQIHKFRPHVYHLKRGEIFTINDKKILTIGGATSVDKDIRTPFVSWWPQENISYNEMMRTEENLDKNDRTVDYILTHTCPAHIIELLFHQRTLFSMTTDAQEKWFDELYLNTKFKHWYFGHMHMDENIKYNITGVYNKIIELT